MALTVHKFGGGVLDAPQRVGRLSERLDAGPSGGLIVVSAFYGTTRRLEALVNRAWEGDHATAEQQWRAIQDEHLAWAEQLLDHPDDFRNALEQYAEPLHPAPTEYTDYGAFYDAVVSQGEMMSSLLVYLRLRQEGRPVFFADARELVVTDEGHTAAGVDWHATRTRIETLKDILDEGRWVITQGFIGRSRRGQVTTLGKEGSDYSAALFAAALDAEAVTLWKNVPGILTADPQWDPTAQTIPVLSYDDAYRLGRLGAQVLHPMTLEVARTHRLRVRVPSFDHPGAGTTIGEENSAFSGRGMVIRKVRAAYIDRDDREPFFRAAQDLALDVIAHHPVGKRLLIVGAPNAAKWHAVARHLTNPYQDARRNHQPAPFEAWWVTLLGGHPLPDRLAKLQTVSVIPYAEGTWRGEQLLVRAIG